MTERVVVERLRLRVAGAAPDEAARLGEAVARELARRLADGGARPLGAVRVRVGPLREGAAADHRRIAAAVARSLR
jgi:hypothetical protein